jgi:uroporphyrinogen-III synthase
MPNESYSILSTKPIADSLIAEANRHGVHIHCQAFIKTHPVIDAAIQQIVHALATTHAYVVFTSTSGVLAVTTHYLPAVTNGSQAPGWKIFCLETATLQEVSTHFSKEQVLATAGYGKHLAQHIVQQGNVDKVIFFCGNLRRDELPGILRDHGITVEEYVVYETIPTPVKDTSHYDGIFFFSPSAVKSYFSLNTPEPSTVCFAIGTTTADALKTFTDNKIIISTATSAEQMVQTAVSYFEQH